MIFNSFYTKFLLLGLTLFACKIVLAGKQITLEQLYGEMRSEPADFFGHHYGLMWTISGYRDTLYNVTVNVTERCAVTSGATQFMLEQLKITEETSRIVMRSLAEARNDVLNANPLVDHPLKFVCRRVAKAYGKKPELSTAFNVAKIIARQHPPGTKPAYTDTLITSLATMGKLLDSWATIPELARAMANSGFRGQLIESQAYTKRHHLLVKTVFQVVHDDDEYANQMQDVYEHMLNILLPQITTNATAPHLTLSDQKTFWFFPRMIKMFYHFLKQETELMQEFNATAAIVGKGHNPDDLDFSKL